jgi:hypothetical protein
MYTRDVTLILLVGGGPVLLLWRGNEGKRCTSYALFPQAGFHVPSIAFCLQLAVHVSSRLQLEVQLMLLQLLPYSPKAATLLLLVDC